MINKKKKNLVGEDGLRNSEQSSGSGKFILVLETSWTGVERDKWRL